jgi:hypothetical protein
MNTSLKKDRASAVADGFIILMGIWVIISPFVLGFSDKPGAIWSNLVVGLVIVLLCLISARRKETVRPLIILAGWWVFLTPFVLGDPTLVFVWNNVLAAFMVMGGAAVSEGLHRCVAPDAS